MLGIKSFRHSELSEHQEGAPAKDKGFLMPFFIYGF